MAPHRLLTYSSLMRKKEPKQTIGDYVLDGCLGLGTYAQVFKAHHMKMKGDVAIKIVSKNSLENPHTNEHFMNEIAILKQLHHPLIVEIFEVVENEYCIGIVMEYLEKGDLLRYIKKNNDIQESEIKRIFAQLFSAISYLHQEMNIAHFDIKLENIMLDRNGNIRLIDFGTAKTFSCKNIFFDNYVGAHNFGAPEIIEGKKFNPMADIWSAGVVLFALSQRNVPCYGRELSMHMAKIGNDEIEPSIPMSSSLIHLLQRMLTESIINRASFQEIKRNKWFESSLKSVDQIISSYRRLNKNIDRSILDIMGEIDVNTSGIITSLTKNIQTYATIIYHILLRAKMVDVIANVRISYNSSYRALPIQITAIRSRTSNANLIENNQHFINHQSSYTEVQTLSKAIPPKPHRKRVLKSRSNMLLVPNVDVFPKY